MITLPQNRYEASVSAMCRAVALAMIRRISERFLRNFVLPTTIHLSDGELAGLESYQLDEPETLRFGFRFSPEQNGLRDCSLS
jgi:hypothetical protein